MKYSEYPYKRIDLKKYKQNVNSMIKRFSSSKNAEQQIKIIQEYQKIQKEFHSYGSIAYLNYARNTKDKKAVEENEFYNDIGPEIAAIDNTFTKTINSSKFRTDLLSEFGEHYFKLISMELKSFDPHLVELMKKKNELKNKYRSLLAGAEINFKGKTLNLAGLSPYMQDKDRKIRKEAYFLMNNFFKKNESKLDTIFDKLVKIRNKKARVLNL